MDQSAPDDTVLVAITGSIGAGKSTVADLFEQAGIPVLRSDVIARELMRSDPGMIQAIVEAFGPEAYVDGEPDRRWLADRIFNDRELLERMNAIVHPRTIAAQGVRAAHLFAEGHRVVACETALLFETGGEGRFDYVVAVDADSENRLRRAAERDASELERVRQRDRMQLSAEEKVRRADFVIHNDGSREELEANARFVIDLLRSLPPRDRLEVEDEDESNTEQR